MGKLDGRVALVTDGARGQSRSHALALAAESADVVVCDIAADVPVIGYLMATETQLAETVKLAASCGVRALGLHVDARDTAQVQAAVNQTLREFGRIDILLANHGVVDFAALENITDDSWTTIIDTNLIGVSGVSRLSCRTCARPRKAASSRRRRWAPARHR
jgi:NAD(P)-dependent dehydrogenase (short-subunit alcohol dehydrogenase family)